MERWSFGVMATGWFPEGGGCGQRKWFRLRPRRVALKSWAKAQATFRVSRLRRAARDGLREAGAGGSFESMKPEIDPKLLNDPLFQELMAEGLAMQDRFAAEPV